MLGSRPGATGHVPGRMLRRLLGCEQWSLRSVLNFGCGPQPRPGPPLTEAGREAARHPTSLRPPGRAFSGWHRQNLAARPRRASCGRGRKRYPETGPLKPEAVWRAVPSLRRACAENCPAGRQSRLSCEKVSAETPDLNKGRKNRWGVCRT